MAKTNSIEKRPLIIVTLTTTKWNVERRKDNKEFVLVDTQSYLEDTSITQYKIIKIKPETAITGKFRVLKGCNEAILPDGSKLHTYQCHLKGIDETYNSLQEAYEALDKALKLGTVSTEAGIIIERTKETYYNPKTEQVTSDHTEAANWFKGKNPLFISSSQYQKVGVWLEPGEDYVEVNFYYNDRVQRKECKPWTKAKIGGFRLYNDGTISHFYKGKVQEINRTFVTERVAYRSLDVRFLEQSRLSTLLLDLRAPELVGSDYQNRGLCKESLEILRKVGFPKEYWCWGNTRRPFTDTYDLINFATHVQHKNQTNRGASIDEFLANKPFGLGCENVLEFNKGVILRIPGYRETWVDGKGRHFDYKPGSWETDDSKIKLLKAEVYERYRVWISNDGKTRSCQELIHNGECWSQTRWDNICWSDPSDYIFYHESRNATTDEELSMQQKAKKQFVAMAKATYTKIFKSLPILTRFESFVADHPDLETGAGLRNLLDSLYHAPKLTETLIKLGYGQWFYEKPNRYSYSSCVQTTYFSLEHVLERFGITCISDYKELAGNTMYKNLGISKGQFNWLAQYESATVFMDNFKNINYIIPNTNHELYSDFAAVPVKYLQIIAEALEKIQAQRQHDYWYAAGRIQDLLDSYEYNPLDLEKAIKRGLDIQTLIDYLRMRRECRGVPNFDIRDWDKVPNDATDLRFCHDRMNDFYNLVLAERQRVWRAQEEQRMIKYQEKYIERYKKLKSLSYVEKNNNKIVVVPEKLIELVVEGQVLHHCVGSFATSVAEGRDTIVFLRGKEKPDIPYATISLLKAGDTWKVDQAHTAHNGPITDEDVNFLKRWAVKNNIDPSTIHRDYGLHCHH